MTNKFIVELEKLLERNKNLERAEKEKQYLYSDLKHYGVDVKTLRKFAKSQKEYLRSLSKKELLDLVTKLWNKPVHEKRSEALFILSNNKEKLDKSDMPLIERIMRESRGWSLLDSSIIPLMPTILEKNPETYKYLDNWIRDDDFWVRRSALLAQLLFFRREGGGPTKNKELFFKLAKTQFDENWITKKYSDKEQIKRARFFIRKAIGWVLREMSQRDPQSVYEFLLENKEQMSGLSFREGSRKLPKQLQDKLKR